MAQMFRVGDLAQQMGVTVEELIFKLRSIGVDVSSADDTLDLATVRAIITGESIPKRPREVIMRMDNPPAEEAKKPQPAAADRTRRRRPARRMVGMDEEIPDQVPDLSAMTVPASPRPALVRPIEPAPEAEPASVPEAVEPAPVAHAVAAVEPEPAPAVPTVEEAPAKPAKPKRPSKKAAAVPVEAAVTESAPPDQVAVRTPAPVAEASATAPEGLATEAASAAVPAPGAKPAARPAKKGARTPLESQLRELSDDEIRQRILAQKQAAAAKPVERPVPAGKTKTSRKAKSAADADEIRDLLAKFEESKVRAKTENVPTTTAPSTAPSRGRVTHRPRRERAEPAAAKAVTVEFRDGQRPEGPIYLSEAVTVRELAEKLNVLVKDLMAYLIAKKVFVTANQALPQELAEQICEELGVEAMVISFEE
ncbi:MAG: translation initiation factor IF-2 N-terminal domain-containing protein, partial [Acidobacteriota bacterium]